MGRIDETLEIDSETAIHIPDGVTVIASAACVAALEPLDDSIRTIAVSTSEMPDREALQAASIVVLEVDPANAGSIQRLDTIRRAYPDTPVIAAMPSLDFATTRALMRRGVVDFVELPFQIEEMLAAITDARQRFEPKGTVQVALAPFVVVTKSIGGAGATTIATHLAAALAEERGPSARACVIDCDLQSGDVGAYLGCSPRLTLADLTEADGRLDADLLNSVVCAGDERVDIVAAPSDIQPIEALDFDRLMDVITLARKSYDIVLVDLPANFTNWAVSVIFAATRVVHVNTLSLSSLRHAKRQLQFLQSLGLEKRRVDVVLNRVEQKLFKPIGSDDAAEALNMPIAATIVSEPSVLHNAQDEGSLVQRVSHRHKFAKQIRELAGTIHVRLQEHD